LRQSRGGASGWLDGPVEGRIVLHGHIAEGNGALLERWNGPLACRLAIDSSGQASVTRILVDRVLNGNRLPGRGANLRLLEAVEAVRFPMATARAFVILPIMLGGSLHT